MNDESRKRARLAVGLYHEDGFTLDEIGERLGITRERVRQILAAAGRPSTRGGSAAGRRRREALRADRREAELALLDERREDVLACFRSGGGARQIRERFGVRIRIAQEWLETNVTPRQRDFVWSANAGIAAVPNERLLEDLREAAAELGEAFSYSTYAGWAARKGRRGPQTHIKRFGSWNEARRLAGLRAPKRRERPRVDRISEDECREAVAQVTASLGHPPTASEYELEARRRGLPSIATIRNRLGGGGKWVPAKYGVLLGELDE